MGNDQDRSGPASGQVAQKMCDFCTTLSIKRGSRLISKNQARITDQRPCDCHTLALAPRELCRSCGEIIGQANSLQGSDCPLFAITLAACRVDLKGHRHVLRRVQKIKQPVLLENKSDAPSDGNPIAVTGPAQLLSEYGTSASLNSPQRADERQQGSLAAARWAGEEYYFTWLYGKFQVGQDASPKHAHTECVRQIASFNCGVHPIRRSQPGLLRSAYATSTGLR